MVDPSQALSFLSADASLLLNPFLLPDMDRAVARLRRALERGEGVAIYGDFDADGVTATVLLVQGLASLGGKVIPYIPHRMDEGYGLNHSALERLAQEGITLVVTVDCGIGNGEEIARAKERGMEVIVTDHHTVPPELPPAVAVVDPKREGSAYPFPGLAGVGVAFKLLQALGADWRPYLDLVALGTVTDLMPVNGENRYLVKQGLAALRATSRPGLRELMLQARLAPECADEDAIAYLLGPRLNAAGRVDHAIVSYKLLITSSPAEAQGLARDLEERNALRQRWTEEVLEKAHRKIEDHRLPLVMVGGEDYPAGVVGLVASRLCDEFYRPAVVVEVGPEVSRGSARSIPEFNIVAALAQCRHLLTRFGGHAQAAGFALPTPNLEALRECLVELAARQVPADLRPTLFIDAEISLASLNGEIVKLTRELEPFGRGNPPPIFLSRGVKVLEARPVGRGEHLRLKLRQGEVTWHAMGFGLGPLLAEMPPVLDIVYTLEMEARERSPLLRLNLLDFAPATSSQL